MATPEKLAYVCGGQLFSEEIKFRGLFILKLDIRFQPELARQHASDRWKTHALWYQSVYDFANRQPYDCSMPIYKFTDSTVVPEAYYLAPEKLISGNPKQSLWMHYTDARNSFFAGIWHSEIGKWRISYTEEEYCKILEGTSVITDSSGHAVTVTTGESFVIPSGFIGTWEVVIPTRKEFVIFEPAT